MERKKILAQEPKNQYDQKKTWNSKSSIANFSRKKQGLYAQEKAIVHVKSLLNNTFVTLTTLDGKTLAWSSGGTQGFKGSRRATSYAAQLSGEKIGKVALAKQLSTVVAKLKGPGYGKAASLRGLKMAGVKVVQIQDISSIPFNGCRPKKKTSCVTFTCPTWHATMYTGLFLIGVYESVLFVVWLKVQS